MMDFRILGLMEVLHGARRVELPSGRGRSVLAILTLNATKPVAAERLIDELWGDHPPATATTVVHGLVSRLRRALEPNRTKGAHPQVLQTVGTSYCLTIDPDSVDANRFTRLLHEARGKPAEIRSVKLSAALALWRGPALGDFVYEPFAQPAIAALEESRIGAIEDRFEAELALGRDAELVAGLNRAIMAYPFRERLRGFLMVALYRAGRQTEALEVCRSTRALLVEEMGLDPGPALQELEAAILRQDPSLELRRGPERDLRLQGEAPSWLPRERRTVTVVAVDVTPSAGPDADTEPVASVGSESARVATEVLERYGARVERFLGDKLIGLFGFPVAYEDHALRAVRALLDVRTAVHSLDSGQSASEGISHRSSAGLETGDIIVAGPGVPLPDVVRGPVVSAAGRLQHQAGDSDVLVGPAARRLLSGAVILQPVYGAGGEPAGAWRVLEAVAGASAIPRAMNAPMIGRQNELTQLRSAFRRAIRSNGVVRMTVVGEAGIGKSRLAKELVASIGADAQAIVLRCTPPGETIGFFPVRQAVLEAARLHGWRRVHELLEAATDGKSAVQQIGAATGLRSPPATVEELVAPMRRLLETLARVLSLIVVLEDLHWADPTFRECVDRLADETEGAILLLCLARPEAFEEAISSTGRDVMNLEPLPASDIAQLVINRVGPVAHGSLLRVTNLSQGNPLFAEQLLAAIDDGNIDTIPVSLVGLLSMRLDRLGPGERDLLRSASIAGLDFDLHVVTGLLPIEARPFAERHAATLERKRFIHRTGSGRLKFAHALIQMTAYKSMTHEDRARLHDAYADCLKTQRSDIRVEFADDGG